MKNIQISIRQKLIFGFLSISLIMIASGLLSIYFSNNISKKAYDISINNVPLSNATMKIKLDVTTAHLWFEEIISGDTTIDIQEVWNLLEKTTWYCNAILKGDKNSEGDLISTNNQKIKNKVKIIKNKVNDFSNTARIRYQQLSVKTAGSGSELDQDFDKIFSEFIHETDEVEKLIKQQIKKNTEFIKITTKKNQNSILIMTLLGISLAVAIAIIISKNITSPIEKVVKALQKMSQKQINFRMDTKRNDEIGTLYNSINTMNKVFTEMITGIDEIASSVLTASNQLSTISQEISQRANEQAATTEEVATSMEQMLAMINSNTEQAEVTRKISSKSSRRMEQSKSMIVNTLNSVSKVNEKTSIITEIANKTDILSINAAIEAARAGETGKGFAVVANEIRKLADKTAIASDEIKILSHENYKITQVTSSQLEKVIPDITKSAELVNNIVLAGKEQQSGVENINISIQQLTEITNENSASAEEMSASAEELSAQAEQLKSMIASSVNDITGAKQNNKVIDNNKREEQITEHKNKGFNISLSSNDKSDNEFETF